MSPLSLPLSALVFVLLACSPKQTTIPAPGTDGTERALAPAGTGTTAQAGSGGPALPSAPAAATAAPPPATPAPASPAADAPGSPAPAPAAASAPATPVTHPAAVAQPEVECRSVDDCTTTLYESGGCCPMLCHPRALSKKAAAAQMKVQMQCQNLRACPQPLCRPPRFQSVLACVAGQCVHRRVGGPEEAQP